MMRNRYRRIDEMRQAHVRNALAGKSTVKRMSKSLVTARFGEVQEKLDRKLKKLSEEQPVITKNADGTETVRTSWYTYSRGEPKPVYAPIVRKPYEPCPHDRIERSPHTSSFNHCTQCDVLIARKAKPPTTLVKLLPILADHVMPPVTEEGLYYASCIVNDCMRLDKNRYQLWDGWFVEFKVYVKFPAGWEYGGTFRETRFDRVIRAVDPLLGEDGSFDPIQVYTAIQSVLYGTPLKNEEDLAALMRKPKEKRR